MGKGKRALKGRHGASSDADWRRPPAADDGFDSAWMARIEAETARIARSFKLPENDVRVVAQNVAIALWQGCSRAPPGAGCGEPAPKPGSGRPRAPGPYP